ncbi:MAG: FHA domain-containing protein [Actinobacteria bacterium]|nr:FHA domain-containing protein [Actinomycetota bacterium]
MAKPDSQNELTTTLHLGLRSVVGDSPISTVSDYLAQSTAEEREIIENALAGDGSTAMIFIHRGPQKGSRFLLTSTGVAIGRSPESDIFLDDVTVSRKHASIEKDASGFTFKDSGSLNGSYVNNESVSQVTLNTGDEIQIGKFHLLFISAKSASQVTGEK